MGKRPELMGGGLRRSQILSQSSDENIDFDDRILGSGEFVTELRDKGLLSDNRPTLISLSQLQHFIEERYQLDKDEMMRRGRLNVVFEARCVYCYCAVRQLQYPAAGIARYLKIGPPAVSRSIRKGGKFVDADHALSEWIVQMLKQ